MVDIHCHILPGIDDGSSSMEESISMLEIAYNWDVRHIVATSHGNLYEYEIEQYCKAFKELQQVIEDRGWRIKLYPGMEIYLNSKALTLLEKKELLTINNTDYVLVEVPFDATEEYTISHIQALIGMGYRVILAHPERYDFIQEDPSIAWKFVAKGCWIQVNYGSLIGSLGPQIQEAAEQLADMGLVHIVATDAHDEKIRSHNLSNLFPYIDKNYSREEIHLWMSENPSRVIKGMELLSVKDIR